MVRKEEKKPVQCHKLVNRRTTPNPRLISNQSPSPLCSACLWRLGLHLTVPFPFVLGKCTEGCCPGRPSPETPSCRPSRKGPAAGQGNRQPLLTGHREGGCEAGTWGRRRGRLTAAHPKEGGRDPGSRLFYFIMRPLPEALGKRLVCCLLGIPT